MATIEATTMITAAIPPIITRIESRRRCRSNLPELLPVQA